MAPTLTRVSLVAAICLLLAVPALASPFSGTFEGDGLKMVIRVEGSGYAGTITLGDKEFPFTGQAMGGVLGGRFTAGANRFPFTARLNGDRITFETGSTSYALTRKSGGNPLDPGGPPNPLESDNPLEPDQPVRPEPPRPAVAGKLVDHPAGMKVLVPEGWVSQVQGQGLSLGLAGMKEGDRPRVLVSIFLYDVPPATKVADQQIVAQLKQNLTGGGWEILGQPAFSNRGGRSMVTINAKHKDPKTPLYAQANLILLAPGKLAETFAIADQTELARQAGTLSSIIDSMKLGAGGPRPPTPGPAAGSWAGRWVGGGATLTIMEMDGVLRGDLQQSGATPGRLEARIGPDGQSFSGTLTRGSLALPCRGRRTGAMLELGVGTINPMTGQPVPGKETTMSLTKEHGADPVPPTPPKPDPHPGPSGSQLDGRWVGDYMVVEIRSNSLTISFPDDPEDIQRGTIMVRGNKLAYTIGGETEEITFQLKGDVLILTFPGGEQETYRRAR